MEGKRVHINASGSPFQSDEADFDELTEDGIVTPARRPVCRCQHGKILEAREPELITMTSSIGRPGPLKKNKLNNKSNR